MSNPVEDVVGVLDEHGYSSSPWLCRCGARLLNAESRRHVAEVLVDRFKIGAGR